MPTRLHELFSEFSLFARVFALMSSTLTLTLTVTVTLTLTLTLTLPRRVRVWWSAERRWFAGKVTEYDAGTPMHVEPQPSP